MRRLSFDGESGADREGFHFNLVTSSSVLREEPWSRVVAVIAALTANTIWPPPTVNESVGCLSEI
jgi:hypothetical protein